MQVDPGQRCPLADLGEEDATWEHRTHRVNEMFPDRVKHAQIPYLTRGFTEIV